jgi:hypothetical protein
MFPGLTKYLVLGATALAFVGGFSLAKLIGDSRIDRLENRLAVANLNFAEAVLKQERANREKMAAIGESLVLEDRLAKAKTAVVTREVIRYETLPGAGDCVHIPDWVQLHNKAAAAGPVSGDSSSPTGVEARGAGPRVTDVDSIRTVTENYRLCNDLRIELAGWRQYGAELVRINEQARRSSRR